MSILHCCGIWHSQPDPSKVLKLQIPNAVVTFTSLQIDKKIQATLLNQIRRMIAGPSNSNPEEYLRNLQNLFDFWTKTFLIIKENVSKYPPPVPVTDPDNPTDTQNPDKILSRIEAAKSTLENNFKELLLSRQDTLISNGVLSCEEILRYFSDSNGFLFLHPLLTSLFLLVFVALYRAFLSLFGNFVQNSEENRNAFQRLENILNLYKQNCIKERLSNIKMLQHQTTDYNVHNYQYEADIRRDTSFGGRINDFYDKRPKNQIKYKSINISSPEHLQIALLEYKKSVETQYDVLFNQV